LGSISIFPLMAEDPDWEALQLIFLHFVLVYVELTMARPMKCFILLIIMEWVAILFNLSPYWARFL